MSRSPSRIAATQPRSCLSDLSSLKEAVATYRHACATPDEHRQAQTDIGRFADGLEHELNEMKAGCHREWADGVRRALSLQLGAAMEEAEANDRAALLAQIRRADELCATCMRAYACASSCTCAYIIWSPCTCLPSACMHVYMHEKRDTCKGESSSARWVTRQLPTPRPSRFARFKKEGHHSLAQSPPVVHRRGVTGARGSAG